MNFRLYSITELTEHEHELVKRFENHEKGLRRINNLNSDQKISQKNLKKAQQFEEDLRLNPSKEFTIREKQLIERANNYTEAL